MSNKSKLENNDTKKAVPFILMHTELLKIFMKGFIAQYNNFFVIFLFETLIIYDLRPFSFAFA